jgi:hypothetical protein
MPYCTPAKKRKMTRMLSEPSRSAISRTRTSLRSFNRPVPKYKLLRALSSYHLVRRKSVDHCYTDAIEEQVSVAVPHSAFVVNTISTKT